MKVHFIKSPNPNKKYRAVFDDGTHADFGAVGYSDFIFLKDEKRKKAYLDRHRARENWNDYKSAGALSRWILWNLPTFEASVSAYKRRFGLD